MFSIYRSCYYLCSSAFICGSIVSEQTNRLAACFPTLNERRGFDRINWQAIIRVQGASKDVCGLIAGSPGIYS